MLPEAYGNQRLNRIEIIGYMIDLNNSLTLFVARYFKQAQRHLDSIDDRVIDKALDWIFQNQAADGSFSEVGGGLGEMEDVPLTAYVVLALLETKVTDILSDIINLSKLTKTLRT